MEAHSLLTHIRNIDWLQRRVNFLGTEYKERLFNNLICQELFDALKYLSVQVSFTWKCGRYFLPEFSGHFNISKINIIIRV